MSADFEGTMTVEELIQRLETFPKDLLVIYKCCSDWAPMSKEDVTLVKGVPKNALEWVMRVYKEHEATMSEENQRNMRDFVAFPGN